VKVSFELSARDIAYFRERLKRVSGGERAQDEETVVRLAKELVEEAVASEPPEFVRVRLVTLEQLVAILRDEEWRLEGRDRTRILDALAYFVDPDDMISDRTPGIGFLDDAIMIELVAQELKHDIKAYEDFCAIRKKRAVGAAEVDLEAPRQSLQSRMRRRRHRDRQTQRDRSGSARSPFRLW
jgi:uncharacterized membrane protein YkvA (DUF1232 family)